MSFISRSSLRHIFSSLAVAFWLSACGSAPSVEEAANDAQQKQATEDSFEMASLTPDETLSDMRGGFLFAGGLQIDFGLLSTTLVNGNIASSFNIHSLNNNIHANNNGTPLPSSTPVTNAVSNPSSAQQIIQVGGSNFIASSPATVSNSILTIVQNNTNGSVIQNHNVLNLTVNNFASLRNQNAIFNSFGPLIRSLH